VITVWHERIAHALTSKKRCSNKHPDYEGTVRYEFSIDLYIVCVSASYKRETGMNANHCGRKKPQALMTNYTNANELIRILSELESAWYRKLER